MRVMGLDVGDKTIGVAVSDLMGWTAQGLEVIRRSNEEKDINRLAQIVEQYQVEKIVVGLPKNMNGTIGPQGEKVQRFSEKIKNVLKLPVEFWDERLTTVAAERMLIEADVSRSKRKKVIDKMAAVLILQGYLDSV
ncbi:putative Holliday junction resolvase [Desulfohalotomaculum tongense]|uniref:Holliday junction resolvase RuvX n=1 Tax=Desulforadius tongensis TaxID=1216062 RepID=UPI001EE5AEBB|nr:Holliday junction resolvase RuvX [Desulforadius tongensis]MBM7855026.1 putative Holliday junction resolvase [Desulforadius tongensis]